MPKRLSDNARWRLVVGFTAALATALIAGCCGGPFGANDNCGCDCDDDGDSKDSVGDAGVEDPDAASEDAGDAA